MHDADLGHDVLAATNDAFGVDSMPRTGRRQRAANEAHLEQRMRVRRGVWRAIAERIIRLHVQRFTTELAADLRRHGGRPVDVVETGRSMLGRAIADFCVGGDPDGNPAGNPDGDPGRRPAPGLLLPAGLTGAWHKEERHRIPLVILMRPAGSGGCGRSRPAAPGGLLSRV